MSHLIALVCGYVLDALFGDPYQMPHIIRLIGTLISGAERLLRRIFPPTPLGERMAGAVLVMLVAGGCSG
jgi:adenosylcobinamide-phosphate synthase